MVEFLLYGKIAQGDLFSKIREISRKTTQDSFERFLRYLRLFEDYLRDSFFTYLKFDLYGWNVSIRFY